MRLLHAETFRFHEFDPGRIPGYAILSHTWGDNEVTYEDVAIHFGDDVRIKDGWKKIKFTCREALDDQLEYVWVDTCCIDKRSSAELSEAINSMFAWYQQAVVCYVYLADIKLPLGQENPLRNARWFTRGWTLQELLAPRYLELFSVDWVNIGRIKKASDDSRAFNKNPRTEPSDRGDGDDGSIDISGEVAAITGIELEVLNGQMPLESVCIARRMSWASSRQTSRPEDISYCLLGLFNINMPTIYGEGHKAFRRLQEEIVKSSDDHSLFAWIIPTARPSQTYGLLAASPADFANSKDVSAFRDWTTASPFSFGNLGLAITLPLVSMDGSNTYKAILNCSLISPVRHQICLLVRRIPGTVNHFQRERVSDWLLRYRRFEEEYSRNQIYLRQDQILPSASDVIEKRLCQISFPTLGLRGKSTYLVSSFLHTDIAVRDTDWYDTLLRQEVSASSEDLQSTFYLAGERSTLSMVFCVETIAEQYDDGSIPDVGTAMIDTQLWNMKEQRKRHRLHNRKKWRRYLKGTQQLPEGDKFLILVGTAHNSHQPVCIPFKASSYRLGMIAGLALAAPDKDQSLSHDNRKYLYRALFEDLAAVFQTLAKAHWMHPDRNIRSRLLEEVSMTKEPESPGRSIKCELQIKRVMRYELDGKPIEIKETNFGLEFDSSDIAFQMRTKPSANGSEASWKEDSVSDLSEPDSDRRTSMQQTGRESDGALRDFNLDPSSNESLVIVDRGYWTQWTGEIPEPVLHINVFELGGGGAEPPKGKAEEASMLPAPKSPETPVDLTTVDLTSFDLSRIFKSI